MTELQISPTLSLPLDFVTKTCAILAQRRKGKTYTGAVFAEELVDARIPWVALDPTGAWWGLRAAANAIDKGLPVTVFGGQRGQLPLDASDGRLIADIVVDHPGYFVVDLSLLGTRAAERTFAYGFADRLLRRKMQPGMDFPLHLFVDEADMFVPQDRDSGDNLMLGAFQGIVRRGGLHGLGTTLISQRPALVNKNALTQLDMLVLLRLVAGNDQDYVDTNYIKRNSTKEQRAELMESWASLRLGEAYVWEPGAEPSLFERVQIRERRTFNSSQTPRVGEQRVEPRQLADADLAVIKEAMAETIERAKAEDPKELRKKIAELERHRCPEPDVIEPERIEIPVLDADARALIERVADQWDEMYDRATETVNGLRGALAKAEASYSQNRRSEAVISKRIANQQTPGTGRPSGQPRPAPPVPPAQQAPATETTRSDVKRRPAGDGPTSTDVVLKKGAVRMLTVLGQFHPRPLTRDQLATLAQVTRGGTFSSYLSSLNIAGYIDTNDRDVALTQTGLDAAGDAVAEQPMTTEQLVAAYSRKLKSGARRMLDLLVAAYPSGYTRNDLSDAAEVSRGGTFSSYLSSLVTNGLAEATRDEVKASPSLFLEQG